MKKIFLSIVLASTTVLSFAQETDSVQMILDNYMENIGGEEAWSQVEGIKMTAEVDAQGMTIPLEIYQMADGRSITKFSFQGMEMSQGAFDGEVLWSTNFMTMEAEKADDEATENAKRAAKDGMSPFINYKDKGYTIELVGEETVEGVECYKLKVTKGKMMVDGEEVDNISYTYFDKENFVPIKAEQEIMTGEMKGQTASTVFSDYQEVDGLYFPFSITSGSAMGSQTVEFDEIIVNPDVDDDLFAFPGN